MGKQQRQPISSEELAGLIMAVMAEANGAGWSWHYRILDNGSLILQLQKAGSRFAVKDDNGRGPHLVIVDVTAENRITAGLLPPAEVTAASLPPSAQQTPAGDLPPSWSSE